MSTAEEWAETIIEYVEQYKRGKLENLDKFIEYHRQLMEFKYDGLYERLELLEKIHDEAQAIGGGYNLEFENLFTKLRRIL